MFNDTMQYLNAIYYTLRKMKQNSFRTEDYKWKLGSKIVNEILPIHVNVNTTEKRTLFGIDVEIDFENPDNLQLFEDITNKVSIPYAEYEEVE